mgnify:CR=1 FL=1
MKRKTFVPVILSLICFSFFCSCSANEKKAATTANESSESTIVHTAAETSGTTVKAARETTDAFTVSAGSTETTIQKQTESSVLQTSVVAPASEIPGTTAEIVKYFNKAANKVKTEKPGYKFIQTPQTGEDKISIFENLPFHGFITKFAVDAINRSSKETVVEKGASHNDYPVKNQDTSSRLEPEALKNAECVNNGRYDEIILNFRDEALTALPDTPETTMHGKAFNLLTGEEFKRSFGGFDVKLPGLKINITNDKFEPTYTGSFIKCKIDKLTGSMIYAVYCLNTYSDIDMAVHVNNKTEIINIKMEYSVTDEYIFS